MKYKKGEVLFKQEDYAKNLAVIAEGKLELTIQFRLSPMVIRDRNYATR